MEKNMQKSTATFPYRFLVAPLVLLAFALCWYQFSVIYIQGANAQLVRNDNYAVYVPIQQIHAYLGALLEFTYLTVGVSLIMFAYFLVRYIQFKRLTPAKKHA
ncbi:MAG: hypothetical protein ACREBS_05620 [Nitrososphaerales archaeon]